MTTRSVTRITSLLAALLLALVASVAVSGASSYAQAYAGDNAFIADVAYNSPGNCSASGAPDCWDYAAGDNGADCPSGDVCFYTDENYTGLVFELADCLDPNTSAYWQLLNWSGTGSVVNNNNPASPYLANVVNSSGGGLLQVGAGHSVPSFDFTPAAYVSGC